VKLYTWTTPNGRKVSIALEEMGISFDTVAIDISKDDQHQPEFLAINPNNKIPALVDGDVTVNESGAILLYLAEKTGKFAPKYGTSDYWTMMEWLMWQMGGFGPMLGQAHHFIQFNPGKSEYAEARYHKEALRLYRVLNARLSKSNYVLDELSIVDFAIWPWASRFDFQKVDLNDFPAVRDWYVKLAERPAFQRGYASPSDSGPIPMPE